MMTSLLLTVLLMIFAIKNSLQLFEQQRNNTEGFVYLAYANNPFGPSTLYQFNNYSLNSTNWHTNNEILKLNSQQTRIRRDIGNFYNMVKCATGCNPLIYKGYGCYCGFLGAGYVVDGIDRCCKMHDWCYATTNCPVFLEYFVPYFWQCYKTTPYCVIENRQWSSSYGECSQRLCECDRALAECLKTFPCPRFRAVCSSSPWRFLQNILMS